MHNVANEYQQGYTAYDNGIAYNASRSKEWRDGWAHAQRDDFAITGIVAGVAPVMASNDDDEDDGDFDD